MKEQLSSLDNQQINEYIEILSKKKCTLFIKRVFDFVVSFLGLIVVSPILLIITILIALTSKGGPFFCQTRVGKDGKIFKIIKFRTMVKNAENIGAKVTTSNDSRITKVGIILRKTKLDELPQLINIFIGQMSFVGTRPEVPEYVEKYTDEMKCTLLLRPGLTSLASICYRNENDILQNSQNPVEDYINIILPEKMKYNLEYFYNLSVFYDIKLMFKTVF